jgi:hypothetical protein
LTDRARLIPWQIVTTKCKSAIAFAKSVKVTTTSCTPSIVDRCQDVMLWFRSTQLIAEGACGATAMTTKCARCDDTWWVCEAYPDLPWDSIRSSRACKCGAPGMPCPDCSQSAGPGDPPKMPPGFIVTVDGKGPRNRARELQLARHIKPLSHRHKNAAGARGYQDPHISSPGY